MSTHNLTIENLQTECKIMSEPNIALAFRTHLDRRFETSLADQLQRVLEIPLSHYDGIVRVKQLDVKLSWDQPFDESDFVKRVASKISEAFLHKFQSRQNGIYVWDNRVDYILSYIEMRLGLSIVPDWAFPDFTALRYISPTQAVIELLRQTPELLLAQPKHTLAINDFADIVALLPEADVSAFIMTWPKAHVNPRLSVDEAIRILVSCLPISGLTNISQHPAKSVLRLITLASRKITLKTLHTYLAAARALIALALLNIDKQDDSFASNVFADSQKQIDVSGLPLIWAETLQLANFGSLKMREVMRAVSKLRGQDAKPLLPPAQTHETEPELSNANTRSGFMISSFAGLALLLPYIARDHVETILTQQQIRALLISVLSEKKQLAAETDNFIMSIASFKPGETAEIENKFPSVPESLQAYLSDEARTKISNLSELNSWREYLLTRFAGGLSGLQNSSAAYLQAQFLEIAGRAEFKDTDIHIDLPVLPLGIVLQISGMLGDRGPIPHLQNRVLTISAGEARS